MLYPLYQLYDLQQALLTPARLTADLVKAFYQHPGNPLSNTEGGRAIAAGAEMFERATRRFGKPEFGLTETEIGGEPVAVTEKIVTRRPFCNLIQFQRKTTRHDPRVLIVAPMSGHHATLLRGTVAALLPHHEVYITDWLDARQVPEAKGTFDFDDYISYLRGFLGVLGPETHVIAVCQPAVPVFATVALMEAENHPDCPRSITLMGGPIDPRVSKTKVTELAEGRPLSWFENNAVMPVPFYHPGGGRRVYPGFLQLGGFMSMNLDRHVGSSLDFFQHLVRGDRSSAETHRKFYNEYLSVMDITAEFYLQTVETVFQTHALPRGEMVWRDPATGAVSKVDPLAIRRTPILTVEGELDDISAHGQTSAAHVIAANLPADKHWHHFQEQCGHYGIFNGRRWRKEIMPCLRHFIRLYDPEAQAIPAADLAKVPDNAPERWHYDSHNVEAVRARLAARPKSEASTEA